MYINLHIKQSLLLSHVSESRVFWTDFRKKTQRFEASWKSVKWEPSRSVRTVMTKLIVDFSNFVQTPKKDTMMMA